MIDFCVLGSGMAGSTIANLLSKKYSVQVFDKARGPGGRASNKRFNSNLSFDHGVQYISPKSKGFKKYVQNLYKKKILKTWTGEHLDLTFEKKERNLKFIGKKANNDICKHQLKNIKQNYFSHINKIVRTKNYWEITLKNKKKFFFKSLILTCPYPQLKKLAKRYLNNRLLKLNIEMQPNITAMLAIRNKKKISINSIKFKDDILTWAANENSKKRFKSNLNLWTLQASLKWSKKNINKYKKNKIILSQLVSRFLKLTGFDNKMVVYKKIHGWKYSYSYKKSSLSSSWNKKHKLGICGDWFLGSKVEDSWTSANSLFKAINKKT